MSEAEKRKAPELTPSLRRNAVNVPEVIAANAGGIRIMGKLIRSLIFSTDIAIIKNSNADAVIAVYPFTPHPAITQAIIQVSHAPVFCGVGGGLTYGPRSANIALHAEFQGAAGVVLNAPAPLETIRGVKSAVDVPLAVTVVSALTDVDEKIENGADILNVSGGPQTPEIVRKIRERHPDFPIIATGGPSDESILRAIEAGADAITYTPPTCGELFKVKMEEYRRQENEARTKAADS